MEHKFNGCHWMDNYPGKGGGNMQWINEMTAQNVQIIALLTMVVIVILMMSKRFKKLKKKKPLTLGFIDKIKTLYLIFILIIIPPIITLVMTWIIVISLVISLLWKGTRLTTSKNRSTIIIFGAFHQLFLTPSIWMAGLFLLVIGIYTLLIGGKKQKELAKVS